MVPLILSLLYRDGSWESFLLPAAGMMVVGGTGLWAIRPPRSNSSKAVGYLSNQDVWRAVLTVCMLLGRLEVFTVLALLSPAFWRR